MIRKVSRLGATTTHRIIEKSDVIKKNYPVLKAMEEKLASIQVRNWGTIGGNLAHADSAGDPAPVLISLDAKIKLGSKKGDRVMSLEDFYTDLFETAMEHVEIVLEVQVPPAPPKTGSAYQKFNLLENDQGIVAVAATVTADKSGVCTDAKIVLGNAGVTPIRAKSGERVLIGKKLTDKLMAEAGEAAAGDADPFPIFMPPQISGVIMIRVLTKRMVNRPGTRQPRLRRC
jgi:carbon-monoxide dehydrogenase medium subunit